MILTVVPHRCITVASKLRMPAIKFRYGTGREVKPNAPGGSSGAAGGPQAKGGQTNEPIYDFQLPLRYRRKPIPEEEIAYINGGGAM